MYIDVKHIAKLSYLKIEDAEIESYQKKMEDIIHMVEQLPEMGNYNQKPKVEDAMNLREDVVQPSFPRDEMLKNAPHHVAGCILVPKTIEAE